MFDYTIYYKEPIHDTKDISGYEWDVFISAYNSSERVNQIYDAVNADKKLWIIQPEYGYSDDELPLGELILSRSTQESAFVDQIDVKILKGSRICIDITGFIKPYMFFLLRWLRHHECMEFDVIYTEPDQYQKKENTKFSDEIVSEVRQIHGYRGDHSTDTSHDVLVVGSGYDDELISHVAEFKSNADKYQMIGFPSLRADMYQENMLNAHRASEAMSSGDRKSRNVIYAPANDPFVTATVLSSMIHDLKKKNTISNLYLSPLATKPQALGFALFFIKECLHSSTSIIYPFCVRHSRQTSKGISRIWKYRIEF